MNKESKKLIYAIIGTVMLVLLKTSPFQDALGLSNTIGIPYIREILYFVTNLISFLAVLLFITLVIKFIIRIYSVFQFIIL